MDLTPEQMEELAEKIADKLAVHLLAIQHAPVLTMEEAKILTKTKSTRGFNSWCRKRKVSELKGGRYCRELIMRNLEREAKPWMVRYRHKP